MCADSLDLAPSTDDSNLQLRTPSKTSFRHFHGLYYHKILDEDYPSERRLSFSYKRHPDKNRFEVEKSNTFGLEPSAQYQVREPGHSGFASDIKFYNDSYGVKDEFRFYRNGRMRFWADWGAINVSERPIFIQNVLNIDSRLTFVKACTVCTFKTQNWTFATRLRYKKTTNSEYDIAEKVMFIQDRVLAGIYGDFSINMLLFKHFDALFGYKLDKHTCFYLEHESLVRKFGEHSNMPLGKISATCAVTGTKRSNLAQLGYNFIEKKLLFTFAGMYRLNKDITIRSKIDSDGNMAAAVRYWLNKNVTLAFGASIPLLKPKGSSHHHGDENHTLHGHRNSFGARIEFFY